MIELAGSIGALLGGVAAAISVWRASSSHRSRQEDAIIESIRVHASETKGIFRRYDRIIGWPLFLDLSERFFLRIGRYCGSSESLDDFKKLVSTENFQKKTLRELSLAAEESAILDRAMACLSQIEVKAVEISRRFPISSTIISLSHQFLQNTIIRQTDNSDIYSQIFANKEYRETFLAQIQGETREDWLYSYCSIIADHPMNDLEERTQSIINDIGRIIYLTCDNIVSKEAENLKKMIENEINNAAGLSLTESTISGNIRLLAEVNRKFYKEKDWDALVTTLARIEKAFEKNQ